MRNLPVTPAMWNRLMPAPVTQWQDIGQFPVHAAETGCIVEDEATFVDAG